MPTESENPYAPPQVEIEQQRVHDPGANLEILRLATRAMILALFALFIFPIGFLIGPVAIGYSQRALLLIDRSGAGLPYRGTAKNARIVASLAVVVSLGALLFGLFG